MAPSPAPGLPTRAKLDESGLYLALAAIPRDELRDPFLHETVRRVGAAPSLVHIAPDDLGLMLPSAAPAGIIFHVARCGSTLVSQLLKQHAELTVYSEPTAINELLMPPHASPRERILAALRSLAGVLATHAGGRPYVLKLSSWNALWCDLVADAFPHAPWALCVRDPLEVCASLLSTPPAWLEGDHAARFAEPMQSDHWHGSLESRAAIAFARFCDGAHRLDASRGLLLPYRGLPADVWKRLAPHFGISVAEEVRGRMADAARLNSKAPPQARLPFVPDQDRKQRAASAALRDAVDRIARPAYDRLEANWGSPVLRRET